MGMDIMTVLSRTTIDTGTPGYVRFGALHIQERWISTMTDEQWHQASRVYNNMNTFIHPMYYTGHPLPIDLICRNIQVRKNCCRKYEDSVWQWRAEEQREGLRINISYWLFVSPLVAAISSWKQQQTLVIPERTVTISKQGRQMEAKICQRCRKHEDGQGKENHKRDFCEDGFPIWNRVPHPLPELQANGINNLGWREDQIQTLRFLKHWRVVRSAWGIKTSNS